MNRRWVAAGAAVVAFGLVGLMACSTSGSTSAPPPKVPAFTSTTATPSSAVLALPTSCDPVALAADVDKVVGHQLVGSATQVVGIPQASIGRLGRLDCYYGIPAGQPVTAGVLVIGIASYTDAQAASHRASVTVNSARNAGAATSDVSVDGAQAVLLAGQQNEELVLAHGSLTVLVTAANGVLTQGKFGPQLGALAQKALAAAQH